MSTKTDKFLAQQGAWVEEYEKPEGTAYRVVAPGAILSDWHDSREAAVAEAMERAA